MVSLGSTVACSSVWHFINCNKDKLFKGLVSGTEIPGGRRWAELRAQQETKCTENAEAAPKRKCRTVISAETVLGAWELGGDEGRGRGGGRDGLRLGPHGMFKLGGWSVQGRVNQGLPMFPLGLPVWKWSLCLSHLLSHTLAHILRLFISKGCAEAGGSWKRPWEFAEITGKALDFPKLQIEGS